MDKPAFHFAVGAPAPLLALQIIKDVRDYHAEYGFYPNHTVAEDQCFDDWAADLADHILTGGSAPVDP